MTDAALRKIVESQAARERVVLHDLENDLRELEQQYQLTSEEFFHRWQAGEMPDTANFMDWNALYQMALDVRERLKLLCTMRRRQRDDRGTSDSHLPCLDRKSRDHCP